MPLGSGILRGVRGPRLRFLATEEDDGYSPELGVFDLDAPTPHCFPDAGEPNAGKGWGIGSNPRVNDGETHAREGPGGNAACGDAVGNADRGGAGGNGASTCLRSPFGTRGLAFAVNDRDSNRMSIRAPIATLTEFPW